MNKRVYCTIVSSDYLHRAVALMFSIQSIGDHSPVVVLVAGAVDAQIDGLHIMRLEELCRDDDLARRIMSKYASDGNRLRWSLKSVLMRHLLKLFPDYDVLYCDCDFCFVDKPVSLFEDLSTGGIVLTPHWRPANPARFDKAFRLNFMDGLYNAGCVAANRLGVPALTWWAEACHSACEVNYAAGLYDDQKYLDLMPVHFANAVICRHKGYNVAVWNRHLRSKDANGRRCVPDRWPVILVHFNNKTIARIERGKDSVLKPHLSRYKEHLRQAAALIRRVRYA